MVGFVLVVLLKKPLKVFMIFDSFIAPLLCHANDTAE
jgi:hypothetical protein